MILINRKLKEVHSHTVQIVAHDKLVIATGFYAWIPPIKGTDSANCFVYYTIVMIFSSVISKKNGTYSVIPRGAGGEITPEGLIAVVQIAKKYHLCLKITGSQRIGLFGAQKDDISVIRKE